MTIWCSSDLHLDHINIIRYSNRPFATVTEMNDALLTYHNERVKVSDHWWYLGDATMRRGNRQNQEWFISLMKKFNGHKSRFFLGNHDHFPTKTYLEAGFEEIQATHKFDDIVFSHIPIHPKSLSGVKANVHGHTHASPDIDPNLTIDIHERVRIQPYVNICVEKTNYAPITLEDIKERIALLKDQWSDVKI